MTPLRLMPMGDSITMGSSTRPSYRRPLQFLLRERGIPFACVGSLTRHEIGPPPFDDFDPRHEGHWGWRSLQVLERADDWFRDARPDALLLHLGTNDCIAGLPPAQTLDWLKKIILVARCYSPRLVTFWARLVPNLTRPDLVAELNALIDETAPRIHRPDAPVVVVDQWTDYDATTDNYDGTHPGPSGEEKLARRWFEAIERHYAPARAAG